MATAVSAALRTLAQDAFLPAADLQADPVFTHTDAFVDDPLAPADISAKDPAQSGELPTQGLRQVSVNGEEGYGKGKGATLAARLPEQDYDELFDSAPLPPHTFETTDSQPSTKKTEEDSVTKA
jgi:HemY protein